MYKLSGIPNCDTVKKAKKKLDELGISYEFRDFKKTVLTKSEIISWKKQLGDWPVNNKGRTYRQIKEEFENATEENKVELLINNSSAIKRPILENKNKIICLGFVVEKYEEL